MPSGTSPSHDPDPFDPYFPAREDEPQRGYSRSTTLLLGVLMLLGITGAYAGWKIIKDSETPTSSYATRPPTSDGLTATVPAWPTIVAQVERSVVHITSYGSSESGVIIPQEQGSGVIYSNQGDVLTNAHVVLYGAQAHVEVTRSDGVVLEAGLVGVDPCTDLALLRLPLDFQPYPVPPKALDQLPGKGDEVAALGYGRSDIVGGPDPSVTRGSISRLHVNLPPYTDLIQHDAPINPGNSGGPLIDRYGRLIGINTLRIVEDSSQGLFFAISIDQADAVWQRLRQQQPPQANAPLRAGRSSTGTIHGQLDRQCWPLSLEKGHTVTVRVRASDPVNAFDPELWIYGPTNLLLDYNDDSRSGHTLEAQVVFTPPITGIYTAVVAPELQTIVQAKGGPYELRVERH